MYQSWDTESNLLETVSLFWTIFADIRETISENCQKAFQKRNQGLWNFFLAIEIFSKKIYMKNQSLQIVNSFNKVDNPYNPLATTISPVIYNFNDSESNAITRNIFYNSTSLYCFSFLLFFLPHLHIWGLILIRVCTRLCLQTLGKKLIQYNSTTLKILYT